MNRYELVLWWMVFFIIAENGATKSFYSNKAGLVQSISKFDRFSLARSILGKQPEVKKMLVRSNKKRTTQPCK